MPAPATPPPPRRLSRSPPRPARHRRHRTLLRPLPQPHPQEGCDLLLDAFRTIAARHPDLHLVLAGPDPHHIKPASPARLPSPALAVASTAFPCSKAAKSGGAFCAAQVFTLPFHQENFGIAVAEALACAKPVLLSDKVNTWQEIVADGSLATLTHWLALTPSEQAAMGRRAQACFAARYDMHTNAQAILKILSELAPNPTP